MSGSIAHNILLPIKLIFNYNRERQTQKMVKALKRVYLLDEVKNCLNAPANTLSGGQQQRLCLARIIALGPEILLLDEPTGSLGFHSANKIESLILELKKDILF